MCVGLGAEEGGSSLEISWQTQRDPEGLLGFDSMYGYICYRYVVQGMFFLFAYL